MSKVFFLGFNKTATTAFHKLFESSGYASYHHLVKGKNLAHIMDANLKNQKPILHNISGAVAYSDISYYKKNQCIEGNQWYAELYQEYPDSFFILQTRNIEEWIESRSRHKKGHFIKRCMKSYGIQTKDEMKDVWRKEREERENQIKRYFRGHPKFMTFDINNDNIDRLIRHFKPEIILKKDGWKVHNKTYK